jgi:hypothetical protein
MRWPQIVIIVFMAMKLGILVGMGLGATFTERKKPSLASRIADDLIVQAIFAWLLWEGGFWGEPR